MGIAERKEREKREMRELIIRTAMDLFVERGYEKTSMRAIANAIDYSPATLYLYFKDKDEIFFAIQTKAFSHLFATMQPLLQIKNPMERLKTLGKVYIKFALDHPKYYDVMFIMESPMNAEKNQDKWEIGKQAHSFLESTVKQCVEAGHMEGDVEKIAFLMWSTVHGMSSLLIKNRLQMYECEVWGDYAHLMNTSMDVLHDALENK
jgi:AcrR family transcriptional regulator